MPGKHAPSSPWSFYLSLARAAGGVTGAVLLVVVLAIVAFGGRGDDGKVPAAGRTPTSSPARSPSPSESPSPSPSPSPSVRAPSTVTVLVLNGNGRAGLARSVGGDIEKAGWKIADLDNTSSTTASTIFYQPGFESEALALQQAFSAFTQVSPATSGTPKGAMLVAVLGRDWPQGT